VGLGDGALACAGIDAPTAHVRLLSGGRAGPPRAGHRNARYRRHQERHVALLHRVLSSCGSLFQAGQRCLRRPPRPPEKPTQSLSTPPPLPTYLGPWPSPPSPSTSSAASPARPSSAW